MRRICSFWALVAVLAVALIEPAAGSAAGAAGPMVVITDPASGALLNGGQPTISGDATGGAADSDHIVVDLYAGSSATSGALPVQQLRTQSRDGAFSVTTVGLTDGTYTVTASEADDAGDVGTSQPVTFSLFDGTPQLTLSAPPAPVDTASPTLAGTARTDPGDADSIELMVYPGTGTDATPVAVLPAQLNPDGSFTVTISPGLAKGTYTAIAEQALVTHETYSLPVTFTITTMKAALSVTSPKADGSEPQTGLDFGGAAGDVYGDADTVALSLYRGRRATGTPIGHVEVSRSGSSWHERWPTPLALGTYTLTVTQGTISGAQTAITRTFRVLAPGSISGPITISSTGRVGARLVCRTGAGTCTGDVLVLSRASFAPVPGGPVGRLVLMFARYSVPAGHRVALDAQLSGPVLATLRRAGPQRLAVSVAYSVAGRLEEISTLTPAVAVGG